MNGGIATPHVEATQAGALAYERGGNAIDATLAAAAVLTVVYPHQTAIGGDLFAVVAEPGAPVRAVNGSGAAPAAIDVEAIRARYDEMPETGPLPVTVPGVLAGWEAIAALGGKLGLPAALEPAMALARDGIEVSRSLAVGIEGRLDAVRADPGLRALFTDDGTPLRRGARVQQPALAQSLAEIARGGAAAFYSGPVGRVFVAGLRALGSPLTADDLAAHETSLPEPLEIECDSFRFLTAPPNSQGFVLLEMLAALGTVSPAPEAALEAALLGIADRDAWLGDPDRTHIPIAELIDPAEASRRLCGRRERLSQPATGRGDTVAVTALDEEGRAVSLIQSVFNTFGAAICEPVTGIICHNRGRGFSLRPGAPNELAPRARPAHTLVPLLVLAGDRVRAAIGTMGGRAQPQILLQILAGALRPEASLAETLAAPRWVVGAKDIDFDRWTVALEAHAGPGLERELAAAGLPVERIPRYDERVGHSQVVRIGPGGIEAASDPRSDGEGRVV